MALARLTHADASEESKAAGNLLRHAQGMGRELHVLAHPGPTPKTPNFPNVAPVAGVLVWRR